MSAFGRKCRTGCANVAEDRDVRERPDTRHYRIRPRDGASYVRLLVRGDQRIVNGAE